MHTSLRQIFEAQITFENAVYSVFICMNRVVTLQIIPRREQQLTSFVVRL